MMLSGPKGSCSSNTFNASLSAACLSPCFTQEPSSIEKVAEIDSHAGVAMSGLTADARTLVDHGRVEAQQHSFTYNEPMPVESLTQSLCDLALRFGEDEEEGAMVGSESGSAGRVREGHGGHDSGRGGRFMAAWLAVRVPPSSACLSVV